jgi:subtilisin family serine protease
MLRRYLHLGAVMAFCALALAPLATAAPSRAERAAARTIAISFKPSVSKQLRAQLLVRAGATPVRRIGSLGFVIARVAPSHRAAAIALLCGSGAARVVQAAHVFRTSVVPVIPNDPAYLPYKWPYTQLGLPSAWASTQGAGSVVIAVIDTGVFSGSGDLSGRIVAGYNALNPVALPDDDNGHGTLVATTAAGALNNLFGGTGACPLCSVMPVKVMNSSGQGTDADIATGVTWAANNGANIINLSLGGGFNDPLLASAIAYAQSRNVLVVAAAGNNGASDPEYPGAYNGVLSVGASDSTGNLMGFSQFGPWVDVAAPGCVEAADLTDSPAVACGTSFASPLTAGVAGLLLASNPALTQAQLKAQIESTAMVTGADVRNGVVDAANIFGVPTAPSRIGLPFLAGIAQSGQTMTASVARWTGSSPLVTTHTWYRCLPDGSGCAVLPGTNGTTYVLTDADIGSRIEFVDGAANGGGAKIQAAPLSEVVVSAFAPAPSPTQPPASVPGVPPVDGGTATPTTPLPSSIVVAPSLPPQPPSIVGSPLPGARLSANPGSLDGKLGVTVGYAWQVLRGGTWRAVPRANDQDFDVPKSLAGLKVRVLVTTRNGSGAVQRQSASGPVTVKAPKILKLKLTLKLKLKR